MKNDLNKLFSKLDRKQGVAIVIILAVGLDKWTSARRKGAH